MLPNVLGTDRVRIVGVIDPDAYTANTYVTGYVDMRAFNHLVAVVMAGQLGSSATVNAKLRQAKDASGTGVKDITGKAITEITQAGTDQSDTQAVITLFSDELDVTNGFTHVLLSLVIGAATSDAGALVLGVDRAYGETGHIASVAEVVS